MIPPPLAPGEVRAALAEAHAAKVPGPALSIALVAIAFVLALSPLAAGFVPAVLLIAPVGLGGLMLAVVMHECAHRSLFGPRLDVVIGHLAGVLTLMPFAGFRRGHAAHHRASGTSRDPTPSPIEARRPNAALTALFGLRLPPVLYWVGVYGPYLLYDFAPTDDPPRSVWRMQSALVLLATVAAHAFATVAIGCDYMVAYSGGFVLAGALYEHLFTMTQHLGLAPSPPGLSRPMRHSAMFTS